MKAAKPDSLVTLGFDTCSSQAAVGLRQGKRLLGEISVDAKGTLSEQLLLSIDQLLGQAGVSIDAVDLVAVSRGPGSFTGLRVGLATAKGLVYTRNVPLVGVVSLEVMAWGEGLAGRRVAVGLPARPGWIYSATYRREADELVGVHPASLQTVEQWVRRLEPGDLVVGEAALRHRELLQEVAGEIEIPGELGRHYPRGGVVAEFGWHRFVRFGAEAADGLSPYYLQPSIAEVRWRERRGKESSET